MMDILSNYGIISLAAIIATAIIAVTSLRGFHSWLALKHAELQAHMPLPAQTSLGIAGNPTTTSRIELADLKERVRKLEAIAAGVDL
jgi:hypothetical protein